MTVAGGGDPLPSAGDTELARFTGSSAGETMGDVLPWRAGWAFVSHEARIGIRTNVPAIFPRLALHLPPLRELDDAREVDEVYSLLLHANGHHLYLGTEELLSTTDLALLLDRLFSDVHHRVAIHARDELFVHAGVVAWKGRAIVLPGRSHSGKSTLVAALLRAGATYYSDEYAVIDSEARVLPYSKPIALRRGPGARSFCSPAQFDADVGHDPVPIGLVAFLEYERKAIWNPQTLSSGQTLLALLANTLLARSLPVLALHRLSAAVKGATGIRSLRGEADETVGKLLHVAET